MKRWMILALFSVNILALPGSDDDWDHADLPIRSEPTLEQKTERIQEWVAQIPSQVRSEPPSAAPPRHDDLEVERGLEEILRNPKTYYMLACCALAGVLTLKSK